MKIDSEGNEQWTQIWDLDDYHETLYAVRQTSDGGYILNGRLEHSMTSSDSDLLVIKTDSEGDIEWYKTYGGKEYDWTQSNDILITPEGGYVFVGQFGSYGAGRSDILLMETDSDGNELWNETYGTKKTDMCGGIDFAADEGYIIAGTLETAAFAKPYGSGCIIKTDKMGNIQWSQRFGGSEEDQIQSVCTTNDGGYIIAGNTESFGPGLNDGWIIKIGPDQPMETPEISSFKPKPGRIYFMDLFGIPFPFIDKAIVFGIITFGIEASDVSGIEKVEYFIDGEIVEIVTEEPFDFRWSGADPGEYELKIRVYNNYGGTSKEVIPIRKLT
jgi:hypothetical protein